MHNCYARLNCQLEIPPVCSGAAVKCHKHSGRFLNLPDEIDVETLFPLAGEHALEQSMHVTNRRREHVYSCLVNELTGFFRPRKRQICRSLIANLGTGTDVSNLPFDDDVWTPSSKDVSTDLDSLLDNLVFHESQVEGEIQKEALAAFIDFLSSDMIDFVDTGYLDLHKWQTIRCELEQAWPELAIASTVCGPLAHEKQC
jgi:hypothetical protein